MQKISSVIKMENGMVMVFDADGEQIPEYQGPYNMVKERILRDASLNAQFSDGWKKSGGGLNIISREIW